MYRLLQNATQQFDDISKYYNENDDHRFRAAYEVGGTLLDRLSAFPLSLAEPLLAINSQQVAAWNIKCMYMNKPC